MTTQRKGICGYCSTQVYLRQESVYKGSGKTSIVWMLESHTSDGQLCGGGGREAQVVLSETMADEYYRKEKPMLTNVNDAIRLFSEQIGLKVESLRNNSFLDGLCVAVYSPSEVKLMEVNFRYDESKGGWYIGAWSNKLNPSEFFKIHAEYAEIG